MLFGSPKPLNRPDEGQGDCVQVIVHLVHRRLRTAAGSKLSSASGFRLDGLGY